MILSTLIYIKRGNQYLMMYRNKKNNDQNANKYIGLGGKLLDFEDPLTCIKREVYEESHLQIKNVCLRGILTFVIDDVVEYTFLYTTSDFTGKITDSTEGTLEFIKISELNKYPLWEGDKYFLDLLEQEKSGFNIKYIYQKTKLVRVFLDGEEINL